MALATPQGSVPLCAMHGPDQVLVPPFQQETPMFTGAEKEIN